MVVIVVKMTTTNIIINITGSVILIITITAIIVTATEIMIIKHAQVDIRLPPTQTWYLDNTSTIDAAIKMNGGGISRLVNRRRWLLNVIYDTLGSKCSMIPKISNHKMFFSADEQNT